MKESIKPIKPMDQTTSKSNKRPNFKPPGLESLPTFPNVDNVIEILEEPVYSEEDINLDGVGGYTVSNPDEFFISNLVVTFSPLVTTGVYGQIVKNGTSDTVTVYAEINDINGIIDYEVQIIV